VKEEKTYLGPLERAKLNPVIEISSKGPKLVGVFSSPSTENGNISSFRNVVFSIL
jgi:hypothetical protein